MELALPRVYKYKCWVWRKQKTTKFWPNGSAMALPYANTNNGVKKDKCKCLHTVIQIFFLHSNNNLQMIYRRIKSSFSRSACTVLYQIYIFYKSISQPHVLYYAIYIGLCRCPIYSYTSRLSYSSWQFSAKPIIKVVPCLA